MLPAQKLNLSMNSKLSFGGISSYSINESRVLIEIDEIRNTNLEGFTSGTLSIELWAMKEAYQGDSFNGELLSSTSIGELYSNHFLSNCRYDLNYTQPPEGKWFFSLMLREWNGHTYITRHFVNFDLPFYQGTSFDDNPSKTKNSNVVRLAYKSEEAANSAKNYNIESPNVRKTSARKAINKPDKFLKKLNKLSLDNLLEIKGIYKKFALTVIEGQPFTETTDLLKIKGLGKKKFEAICDFINKK